MGDYMNNETINIIANNLSNGRALNEYEVKCVISALRKANDCTQQPYYEMIYHDEYDRTERRIMNPVDSTIEYKDGYCIEKDTFEVTFSRIVRDGE